MLYFIRQPRNAEILPRICQCQNFLDTHPNSRSRENRCKSTLFGPPLTLMPASELTWESELTWASKFEFPNSFAVLRISREIRKIFSEVKLDKIANH